MEGVIKMALSHILIGLATVVYCLYLYCTRTFNYWRDQNIDGPTPVPLFGNTMDSVLRRKAIALVFKKIYDDYSHQKVVGVYQMTLPTLLIRDPDIVKQVLIRDFDIFVERSHSLTDEMLAKNLHHADEKTWRVLRNKFTPLFTSAKLKNMFHLMDKTSDKFINFLEKITRIEPEQEVNELISKYTMMNIASCAFGLDWDVTEKSDMTDALNKINKISFTLSYGVEFNMLCPGLLKKLGASIFPKEVNNFFKDLVSQIVTARKGKPGSRNDFMDLLLEMKQSGTVHGSKRLETENADNLEVTEDLMAAQAYVFYVAGYETTATMTSYVLYQLALNPEIQDRAVREIQEVLERHGNKITYDAVTDMKYLDRVFSETLRVHPLGPLIRRVANADYKIPGTQITVKKGQIVCASNYSIHNDDKYWPEPSRFDPDRFSPEKEAERHPAVYFPFGIGPRNCIGIRFAKIQSRVVLAKLLRKFKVEPTENTRKELRLDPYKFITFPIGGIKMNFIPRH